MSDLCPPEKSFLCEVASSEVLRDPELEAYLGEHKARLMVSLAVVLMWLRVKMTLMLCRFHSELLSPCAEGLGEVADQQDKNCIPFSDEYNSSTDSVDQLEQVYTLSFFGDSVLAVRQHSKCLSKLLVAFIVEILTTSYRGSMVAKFVSSFLGRQSKCSIGRSLSSNIGS